VLITKVEFRGELLGGAKFCVLTIGAICGNHSIK